MANDIGTDTGEKFISLDVRGADVLPAETVPVAYRCRVNGTPNGDSSSCQQATLNFIMLETMMWDYTAVCYHLVAHISSK